MATNQPTLLTSATQIVIECSDGAPVPRLTVYPNQTELTTSEHMGHTLHTLTVDLPRMEMDRLLGGGAATVDFLRLAIQNYEDELSADFVSGLKAAIAILVENKDLEDYL